MPEHATGTNAAVNPRIQLARDIAEAIRQWEKWNERHANAAGEMAYWAEVLRELSEGRRATR